MLHFPKVSITTDSFGHPSGTVNQTYNGHSQNLSGHPIFEVKVGGKKADLRVAFNADDCVPTNKSEGEQMGDAVLSTRGQGLVPSFRLFGSGKKRRIRELVVAVRDIAVDGGDCFGTF